MKSGKKQIKGSLFLSIALAGILLCNCIVPASASNVIYDFTSNASSAFWSSSGGYVTFSDPYSDALGDANTGTATLEGGVSTNHLYMHPPL